MKADHRCQNTLRLTVAITVALAAAATLIGAGESSAAGRNIVAHAASRLNGTATARLHLVNAEGSQLTEEGPVSGVLNGTARAELHTGATFTATFTIKTREGSITGQGRATPHGSGRYQSFGGTFAATSGSGRYKHVNGRAGLSGVFDRRTDAVVIQTTGTLNY
jgi:hypothetical protein